MKKYALNVQIIEFALQMFDKGIFNEEDLSVIFGIDFKTGEASNQYWENGFPEKIPESGNHYHPFQIMLQMYDKQIISKEVVLKAFDRLALIKEKQDKE